MMFKSTRGGKRRSIFVQPDDADLLLIDDTTGDIVKKKTVTFAINEEERESPDDAFDPFNDAFAENQE